MVAINRCFGDGDDGAGCEGKGDSKGDGKPKRFKLTVCCYTPEPNDAFKLHEACDGDTVARLMARIASKAGIDSDMIGYAVEVSVEGPA